MSGVNDEGLSAGLRCGVQRVDRSHVTTTLLVQRVSRREGEGRIGRQRHTPDAAFRHRPDVCQRFISIIMGDITDLTFARESLFL